jgi:hypothetical protein
MYKAQCRVLMGTIHGTGSYLPGICPEITLSLACDMAMAAAGSGASPTDEVPKEARL